MSARDDDLTTRDMMMRINKRLVSIGVASCLAVFMMAAAIAMMLPMKEMVPYIVEVEKGTGEARVPAQLNAERYVPSEEVRRFFIRRWLIDAFTINQYTMVRENDPRARAMLRGQNALSIYDEQMNRDQKFSLLVRHPAMTRDVTVESLMPVAGTPNAMVANLVLTTRVDGSVTTMRRMVTVYFDVFQLRDRREAEISPVGLFVTDFKVNDV